MPTYFQRPENALKRANEFIDVGKKQRALDALYDVIKSKKHRTWQKIHEPIMEKYLGLCVDLRKSHTAKEGLYQYKNICQQVNINSLVDVVRRYIALAEEKTEEARQESHQTVVDVDDLEMPDTPESMLLKAVSGEDTQDRTDRAILTPWVKFLWESYRQCLDLLRNNSRVERLYQDIAQQAFKFCVKYTRKTEFRKLCDNLRTHLGHIHKHQHQQTAINLNNPESQNMHLETRLVQLDRAIEMELWQEAFKAVEDIHGLISLSKKPPKPSLMAIYYQKLGMVFWKSGSRLFHASALHRLYLLSKDQRKNLSQEELLKMTSRVLCATLAVPIPPSRNAIDSILEVDESAQEKKRRLSTLLMLQNPPTRQQLIKDLVKYDIMRYVVPELSSLYQWLEKDFHPLHLATSVAPSIQYIEGNDDLSQYVPALEDIIITRVLKQVSQVYQTIHFSRLQSLLPFAGKFRLERMIVDASRTLELQVRIDHRAEALTFGTSLVVAQKEDLNEGPYLQSMPSEQIRNQLTAMTQALRQAVACLQPKVNTTSNVELKEHIISNYRLTAKKEHHRILQRRQIIEDRKEQLEHMTVQKEKEEYEQQEEQRRKAYEAELARLDREREERERQRQQEETEMIRKRHAKERLAELKKSELGARVFKNLDEEELEELDVDDIMAKQVEQLEKEKKELQERLKAQEKKVDYFARARRMEEVPLLQKQHDEDSVQAKAFWEQQEIERIETAKKERDLAMQHRDRLKRMFPDKEEFLNHLKSARQSVYKDKLKDFQKRLMEERKVRLAERKERRQAERRTKWLKEREEEEQRKRDEEMKREREEKERLEREQREREEAEYHERLAKLEEQAAKQREREREIEERQARKLEEDRRAKDKIREADQADGEGSWRRGPDRGPADRGPGDRGPGDRGPGDRGPGERGPGEGAWRRGGEDSPPKAWRPGMREGGWRDREREREASWRSREGPSDEGPSLDFRRDDGPPRDFRRDDRPPRDFRRDDGPPSRDFRRDDGPPSRDFRRDDGPPARDFRRDDGPSRDFRRDDDSRRDREPPSDWRRGGPPRDDPDRYPPNRDEPRGAWRDRGPPRDDDRGSWRSGPRDEPQGRWADRGPPRGGPPRDDERDWRTRGPPRDDDRGPPRGPPRDDDRGPPRDDRGPPRDDRGPPARRDFGREESSWRERGPPRDERFSGMPRDVRLDDPPPKASPTGMPRDARLDEDRRGMPRDARLDDPPPPREGAWRRGEAPSPSKGAWKDRGGEQESRGPPQHVNRPERPDERPPEDDGWTTVKY